jgi:predicted component of type VI protein secretion system
MTPIIAAILSRKVEDVIQNFEPRCRLVSVRTIPDFDRNIYNVSIEFYVVNAPTELVDLSVMLERIR